MSNIDKQTREELRKRYTPPEIPKCKICGSELSIQRCGGGEPTVYACDGYEPDPDNDGMVRRAAGRDIADKHYEESRYIDWIKGGDLDVVALLDELEASQAKNSRVAGGIEAAIKLQELAEVAEKLIAELEAREVKLPELKMLSDYLAEVTMREREDILVGVRLEFHRALKEGGIKIAASSPKGE